MQHNNVVQEVWNPSTRKWEQLPQEVAPQQPTRPTYTPEWSTTVRRSIPYTPTAAHTHTPETMPLDATEYTRRQPRAAASIENRVYVPGIIASFVGVLTFPVYTGMLHYMNIDTFYSFALASGTAALFFVINVDRANGLLYVAERATNHDLNGDGVIGEPDQIEEEPETVADEHTQQYEPQPPEPQRINIDLRHSNNHSQHYGLDIPQDICAKLPKVADAILTGVAFSRPQLVTRRGLLTQSEFHTLKKILEDAGFVQPVEGNKTRVTPAGRSFLSNY